MLAIKCAKLDLKEEKKNKNRHLKRLDIIIFDEKKINIISIYGK